VVEAKKIGIDDTGKGTEPHDDSKSGILDPPVASAVRTILHDCPLRSPGGNMTGISLYADDGFQVVSLVGLVA
jgi:hypothetical protein